MGLAAPGAAATIHCRFCCVLFCFVLFCFVLFCFVLLWIFSAYLAFFSVVILLLCCGCGWEVVGVQVCCVVFFFPFFVGFVLVVVLGVGCSGGGCVCY